MINIIKVADKKDIFDICYIRTKVFVVEQLVNIDLEIDELDKIATHYLIKENELAIGTARVVISNNKLHIGRFAVLKDFRNKGYGKKLLEYILNDLKTYNYKHVYLSAQIQAKGFYKNLGFLEIGSPFLDAGIEHIEMEYIIQQ